MALAQFTAKWTLPDYPPIHVSEADLAMVEKRFETRLPEDYRREVLNVGLPRPTIELLDAIVDGELDVHSLGYFYSPDQIIEETIGWREIGMPPQLVAIASDGGGNKFCFDADRLKSGTADRDAVWFFDHDFGTVSVVAPSFEAWISAYNDVEPSPQAGPE